MKIQNRINNSLTELNQIDINKFAKKNQSIPFISKTKSFMFIFVPFLLFFISLNISAVITSIIVLVKESDITDNTISLYAEMIFRILTLLFSFILCLQKIPSYKRDFRQPLCLSKDFFKYSIVIIFSSFLVQIIGKIFNIAGSSTYYSTQLNELSTFVLIGISMFLTPITEEIAFRYCTIELSKRVIKKFYIINILQAFMFCILHIGIYQIVYSFILGLFFGYVYNKTSNIKHTILLHMIFNILAFAPLIY